MSLNKLKRSFWSWPWYVAIIAAVFPLFLYANNLGQARLDDLWRPLLYSVLFSILIFAVLFLISRDLDKAGLATVAIDIAIFSYGHIYNLIEKVTVFGMVIGRHRYLLLVFFVLLLGVAWLIFFRLKNTKDLVTAVAILSLFFFIVQAVQITYFEVSSYAKRNQSYPSVTIDDNVSTDSDKRDIYLIVLDTYMRSDFLEDEFGYDNSDFLKRLEALGFYIVPCSRSNYAYTISSMASELNMDYLENLDVVYDDDTLSNQLKYSKVRQILANQGYEFAFYQTGYPYIEMMDADLFYSASAKETMSDFEVLFLNTTILEYPYHYYLENIKQTYDIAMVNVYNRVYSALYGLQHPINSDSPLFVYAHILCPHNPKIFTSNGGIKPNWLDDLEDSVNGTYTFIEDQILIAIKTILAESEQEPIIILQSDHGDTYEVGYRNLNLNAYYLPDGVESELYPTITPVNTFRLIFSEYFGMDYPLLPDIVYGSPEGSRYDFTQVEDPYGDCVVQDGQ
ncbi:MAG: hypothetical protein H0S79_22380 [Anaerolineaceae bacterium]|nr:hypothetical protein [Anaerolineaceae bacterium]